jgi:hypothetical protein
VPGYWTKPPRALKRSLNRRIAGMVSLMLPP